MKKFALLIILVCLFLSCKKEDTIPAQLLKNPDVESGLTSWNNFGSTDSGTSFNPTLTTEEAFSPYHSLTLNCVLADPINWYSWSQIYLGNMPVGEDLTLRVRIKGINLSGQGVSAEIFGYDGVSQTALQSASTAGVSDITGTFDWTEYTVTLPELSKNVHVIFVNLTYLPGTTGKVYFDDITLMHN
jgi:hypothetical protein